MKLNSIIKTPIIIENFMSLRKQTWIIICVSISVVVLNQLAISGTFMTQSMRSIPYFTISTTIGAATIAGLTILLLEKSILSRIFKFSREPGGNTNSLFANVIGKISIPDPKTVYLRLGENYFEPKTLIMILGKIFRRNKP